MEILSFATHEYWLTVKKNAIMDEYSTSSMKTGENCKMLEWMTIAS